MRSYGFRRSNINGDETGTDDEVSGNFRKQKYGKAVYLLAKSALATKSVDKVVAWNEKQLRKTSFYKENRSVLNQKQGAGYWLWRPYVILNELKS